LLDRRDRLSRQASSELAQIPRLVEPTDLLWQLVDLTFANMLPRVPLQYRHGVRRTQKLPDAA
jgi:hypothetical protein